MRLVCLFVSLAASAAAQNPAPPSFDVASVKINSQFNPSNRATAEVSEEIHPGSISLRNFTLTMLVAWAYDIQRPQVVAPDWVESVRFDVIAKSEDPCKEADMRRMLQTLLAERFGLRTHRDSREEDAFVLSVSRNGGKMTPSHAIEAKSRPDPGRA